MHVVLEIHGYNLPIARLLQRVFLKGLETLTIFKKVTPHTLNLGIHLDLKSLHLLRGILNLNVFLREDLGTDG